MKSGIFNDIGIEDYHADKEYLSSSVLRQAVESPRHMWYYLNEKEEEKKTCFDFVNAFELALLDQEGFNAKVAVKDDSQIIEQIKEERPEIARFGSAKEYKDWKSKFYAENSDKYIIEKFGPESYDTIETMLDSCYRDAVIQKLIKGIEFQWSIFWQDAKTGLKLKTRPDICKSKKRVVVDVKTARDGSPDGFGKAINKNKLHLQAIMQIDGVTESGLMPKVDAYFWLVIEKNPPYNATLYEFTDWQQEHAFEEYRQLLEKVKESQEKNLWTGYGGWSNNEYGILPAPIKPWTFRNYSFD